MNSLSCPACGSGQVQTLKTGLKCRRCGYDSAKPAEDYEMLSPCPGCGGTHMLLRVDQTVRCRDCKNVYGIEGEPVAATPTPKPTPAPRTPALAPSDLTGAALIRFLTQEAKTKTPKTHIVHATVEDVQHIGDASGSL